MNRLERQAEPKCARHCNNLIQGEYLVIRRLSADVINATRRWPVRKKFCRLACEGYFVDFFRPIIQDYVPFQGYRNIPLIKK